MKKHLKSILLTIILLIILLLCVFFTSSNEKNTNKEVMNLSFVDGNKMLEELDYNNGNVYGWLQVQGTLVNVPILSNVNADISHGWQTSSSFGKKTRKVFVGHNIINISKKPLVNDSVLRDFEDLMAYSYYDFAKDNMYISYTSGGEEKIYVIYAIGFYDYDYDYGEGFNTSEDIEEYIQKVKSNSIYKYDVDVDENDDIITVKTCTRMFGADEKQQFQLDARLLRSGEKTLHYNVKKTDVYSELNLNDSYEKNEEL